MLYILFAGVLTGIVPYTELNVAAPVAVASSTGLQCRSWARRSKLGAIAGLTSVMLVMLLGQPRIFWTMSTDGLLPKVFGTLHPKFRTPYLTRRSPASSSPSPAASSRSSMLGDW